jgi:hypothetical protein
MFYVDCRRWDVVHIVSADTGYYTHQAFRSVYAHVIFEL